MKEVYKFNVKWLGSEKIWREIKISSSVSLADFAYAVLSSFEAEDCHAFCLKFGNKRYEISNDNFYESIGIETENPTDKCLKDLHLGLKDEIEIEYDYGAEWCFDAVLTEKLTDDYDHPSVTDGAGLGIVEGLRADEWREYIKESDETGVAPTYYDVMDKPICWDYKLFDLKMTNDVLPCKISEMKRIYEE